MSDALSPEARRGLSEAGRKGMAIRWGHKRPPDQPATDDPNAPTASMPAGRAATLADYDAILGQPATWTDAKKREEVAGEILANESKAADAEQRRGKLLTREQVAERDARHDAAVVEQLRTVASLISDIVPPDKRAAAQAKASDWIGTVLTKLARA